MQGKEECIHRITILRTQVESREDHNYEPLQDEAKKGGDSVTPYHSTPSPDHTKLHSGEAPHHDAETHKWGSTTDC